MRKITIKDIAEKLNLSVSTVSRALSDDKNIRTSTKEKIFHTAREMGYVRNFLASQLRTGKGKTIGVLIDELSSSYAPKILKGISDVMDENQGFVTIFNADHDPERERNHMGFVMGSSLAGVVSLHLHNYDNLEYYKRLGESPIPLAFVTFSMEGVEASVVGINAYDKAFFLADHLLYSGKRRIVYVHGPKVSPEMKEIDKAFLDALEKYGVKAEEDLQFDCGEEGLTVETGEKIANRILESGVKFDGVFAPTELIAIGIINTIRKSGLRIPEDVGVACFKGSELSELVYPPITTVEAPLEEIGRKAAELVLEQFANPNRGPEKIILNAKIQLRGSTHKESASNA